MADGSRLSSRARSTILLALLALAGIATLIGVHNAFARWRPASARSVGSAKVQITSNRITGLYPGATKRLVLKLRNRTRRRLAVQRIGIRVVSTTKPSCAASPSNLTIRQPKKRLLRLRPRGRSKAIASISMPNSVADSCQDAVFKLRYTAKTR